MRSINLVLLTVLALIRDTRGSFECNDGYSREWDFGCQGYCECDSAEMASSGYGPRHSPSGNAWYSTFPPCKKCCKVKDGYCYKNDGLDIAGCPDGFSREFNRPCPGWCKGNQGFYSGYCCRLQHGLCYRQPPKFKVVGTWIKVGRIGGNGGKVSYTQTTGVENTVSRGSAVAQTEGMSVALGYEVGLQVEMFSMSQSVTETYETSRTVEQSFEVARTEQISRAESGECSSSTTGLSQALWQWVMRYSTETRVRTHTFWCSEQQPRCPENHCADAACQTCTKKPRYLLADEAGAFSTFTKLDYQEDLPQLLI